MTNGQRAVMRVFESELSVVLDETTGHRRIETGGALFGLWTHGTSPTVFLATRPGQGAQRDPVWFGLDPQLYQDLETFIWTRYGVQRLGLWHSHHEIGLHNLSRGDLQRAAVHAGRSHRFKLCDLLCYFVTTPDSSRRHPTIGVKPHVYRDAESGDLLPTTLEVLPGVSPIRQVLSAERGLSRAMESCLEPARRNAELHYQIHPFQPAPPPPAQQAASWAAAQQAGSSPAQSAGRGSGWPAIPAILRKLRPQSGGQDEPAPGGEGDPGSHGAPQSAQAPASAPTLAPAPAPASGDPGAAQQADHQGSGRQGPGHQGPVEPGAGDHAAGDQAAPQDAPPAPVASDEQAAADTQDDGLIPIGDPGGFLNHFVAPTFGRLHRQGISYTVNPSSDARTISCDLVRRGNRSRVLLVLGWNGEAPVIAECLWSDGRSAIQRLPMDRPTDPHDVPRALGWAESQLVQPPRRTR